METIKSGIYEYKGKEYYAFAQIMFGAGADYGRKFVQYKAMYRDEMLGYPLTFMREAEDFKAKFKYLRNM